MYISHDGMSLEVKSAYNHFKEAEKVNQEVLNKIYNYNKLNLKLLLRKLKHYNMMLKPEDNQVLLSKALREAGTKSYFSPNVLTLMADFNSRKGDHEKAI